jgi:small-conductance mechanosensitive channel
MSRSLVSSNVDDWSSATIADRMNTTGSFLVIVAAAAAAVAVAAVVVVIVIIIIIVVVVLFMFMVTLKRYACIEGMLLLFSVVDMPMCYLEMYCYGINIR